MKIDQATAALNAAFAAHISTVFSRLASLTEPDEEKRFAESWDRAVKLHDDMVERVSGK